MNSGGAGGTEVVVPVHEPEAKKGLFSRLGGYLFRLVMRFVSYCRDTSITAKLLGILVWSLLGLAIILGHNTLTLRTIEHFNQENLEYNIPQYKISQYILRRINGFKVTLLHIMHVSRETNVGEYEKNISDNRKRIYDMRAMLVAMQNGGTIIDKAVITDEILDRFTVAPAVEGTDVHRIVDQLAEKFDLLEQAFVDLVRPEKKNDGEQEAIIEDVAKGLDDIHLLSTELAIKVNKRQRDLLEAATGIMSRSRGVTYIVGLVVALGMTGATILYIFLIVSPMKKMLISIRDISRDDVDVVRSKVAVRTHDEVGQLIYDLNQLTENIHSVNTFKSMIEEDETTLEIFHRLAYLLQTRYNFDLLQIYEVPENKRTMQLVYASDHKFLCSEDILSDCSQCRAKRTGHAVSSFEFPSICTSFPYNATMEHYCIPMIAGSKVIAVVQMLMEKKDPAGQKDFLGRVRKAKRYIKEATPVLEAKRFASTLKETTLKDPMTGLYNRRFLESYSETLVSNTQRRKTKIGVMMCDLDFFKEVNDKHGHEAGDMIIIRLAELLVQSVRTADIVIRYGGEEFLIICVDVENREALAELAERIRSNLEKTPMQIPSGTLTKTISIGYAMFPEDSEGFWETVKYADVALYRAKNDGRNRSISFLPEMWTQESY